MSPGIPLRGGFTWTSADPGAAAAPVGRLPVPLRVRAERVLPPGGLVLGAAGAVLGAPVGLARGEVGVAVGTALGCFATNAAFQQRLASHGPAGASPRLFAATVSNAAAGEVGIAFGLGGPAITVTTGATSGLAALEAACGELTAGGVDGMLVLGVDAVDASARRWLREAGWPEGTPDAQVAALVAGEGGPDDLTVLGRVGPVVLGLDVEGSGAGLAAAVEMALVGTGATLGDVAVHASGEPAASRLRCALGIAPRRPSGHGRPLLAAGGLHALVLALRSGSGPALVVDACPSGHVAVVVAWSERS